MNKIIYKLTIAAMVVGSFNLASCSKEFFDPSAGSRDEVTNNVDGLMNLAAGLQRRFTIGRQSPIYNTVTGGGLAIFALNTLNPGNTDEVNLEIGKNNVQGNNAVVLNMWAQCQYGRDEADIIFSKLSIVDDAGDRLGLRAYAAIFYALNLGTLCQYFEQVPVTSGDNAPFVPRADVLKRIVDTLEKVDAVFTGGGTISAKFTSKVPTGLNVTNTIKALIARYSNMLAKLPGAAYDVTYGNKALNAATAVTQSVKSVFAFTTGTPNPLAETFRQVNICGVKDSTLGLRNGLQPTKTLLIEDGRLAFYLTRSTIYNSTTNVLTVRNFVSALDLSVPVYLPGEMVLIQAENYARQSQFLLAKGALDKIIQKTPASDAFGIGCNIPAGYTGALTQPALLAETYRQRRIELFLSGMELEDSRRFERPAPNTANEERNRTFYPYPNQERDNNTNTPDNPAI